ncbi:ATP-binding protein [uncultured Shimia sp.]|uniref:AAA family ATPase n=1 Tax=uncultured Shimia sp. TaxID=573152 RepID=UPI00261C487C|nr:ATP-binding protein [uncultured Shimia sp.]
MSKSSLKYHLVCGYAASGKSTLAKQLAQAHGAVVLSEDQLLAALYADELQGLSDYLRSTRRLRAAIGPHVVALLQAGQAVVMDFAANTVEARRWLIGLARQAEVPVTLHHLTVSKQLCWQRALARNQTGQHEFQLSQAQFEQLAAHFEPPDAAEGFALVRHQNG